MNGSCPDGLRGRGDVLQFEIHKKVTAANPEIAGNRPDCGHIIALLCDLPAIEGGVSHVGQAGLLVLALR